MALELSLRAASPVPIEVDGLLPDIVREKTRGEVERFRISHGNEQVPLAELFHVEGNANDNRIVFLGDMAGVHSIGAGLNGGSIHVAGHAGRHAGSEMTAGELAIDGDAADWLGAEMHGGLIRVRGSAANQVGAAYRGSPRGMTGGAIIVHGNAGDEIAHTMRRGLSSHRRRGRRLSRDQHDRRQPVRFRSVRHPPGRRHAARNVGGVPDVDRRCYPRFARRALPTAIRARLSAKARGTRLPVAAELAEASYELFHGDLVTVGRGEILVRGRHPRYSHRLPPR